MQLSLDHSAIMHLIGAAFVKNKSKASLMSIRVILATYCFMCISKGQYNLWYLVPISSWITVCHMELPMKQVYRSSLLPLLIPRVYFSL